MSKVILDVPEMMACEQCSQAIISALQPQAGIKTVVVQDRTAHRSRGSRRSR